MRQVAFFEAFAFNPSTFNSTFGRAQRRWTQSRKLASLPTFPIPCTATKSLLLTGGAAKRPRVRALFLPDLVVQLLPLSQQRERRNAE
jgi:hypothetical protein